MKIPSDIEIKDAIYSAAQVTGWTDEAALIDVACEVLAVGTGIDASQYQPSVQSMHDREFKIWRAC